MSNSRWYRSTLRQNGDETLLCTEPKQPSVVLSVQEHSEDQWDSVQSLRMAHYTMINSLASFLNGEGQRPEWLDEYHRVTEDVAVHPSLGNLMIVGPKVSTNRITDGDSMTPEDKDKRARLMDRLMMLHTMSR